MVLHISKAIEVGKNNFSKWEKPLRNSSPQRRHNITDKSVNEDDAEIFIKQSSYSFIKRTLLRISST